MVWFLLPGGDIPVVLILFLTFKAVSELLFHVWWATHLPVLLFSFHGYKGWSTNFVFLCCMILMPKSFLSVLAG